MTNKKSKFPLRSKKPSFVEIDHLVNAWIQRQLMPIQKDLETIRFTKSWLGCKPLGAS